MPSSPVNNVWASSAPEGEVEEVTTPLGQVCLARKMSIEGMIEAGILADADTLTGIVEKHTRKVRGGKGKPDGKELNQAAIMRDTSAIKALITVIDKAIPHVVASPVVKIHYTETTVGKTTVTKKIPLEDREDGVVYTDQIGFEDKMFLFDWAAGGLVSMMQFRE